MLAGRARARARPSPFAAAGQDRWSTIEGPRRDDPSSFDLHALARACTKPPAAVDFRSTLRRPSGRALSSLAGELRGVFTSAVYGSGPQLGSR